MTHARSISVIGLGYVGLPVAVAFGKQRRTIGFDIDPIRISELKQCKDRTLEVSAQELAATDVCFSADPQVLREADFHIVTVPTPVNDAKMPDLGAILSASQMLATFLKPGDYVVYESTVYPGVTEEICLPELEKYSGLKAGVDFLVGYSPERINPGDSEHTFTRITKVVSAITADATEVVAAVYSSVIEAGVHKAPSIKVAEAAKVIENTQRDLNIALMNELAIIFNKSGIDTQDVLAASRTKWNFLGFEPGLVGGHCIGVDPYYLTYKATVLGHHPQVILAGRRINDGMGDYVADQVIKQLIRNNRRVLGGIVTILGLAFKENVPDLRNSRVIDIVRRLQDYGVHVQVCDPLVNSEAARREYGIVLCESSSLPTADAVILAVPHSEFLVGGWQYITSLLAREGGVVADVKGRLPRQSVPDGVCVWRL